MTPVRPLSLGSSTLPLSQCVLNSFLASHLLITFANSVDTDQDRHFVGPDLDPNSLTFFLSFFFFWQRLKTVHYAREC